MAFDAYLKIDGIDGEAGDSKHESWISLTSFSNGMHQSEGGSGVQAGGLTGGRVDISDMQFTKILDASTPKLIEACTTGKIHDKATIELCAATGDQHTFMKYELTKVLVSSVSYSGTGGAELRPMEQITLRFSEIKWEYTPFDDAGKAGDAVRAGWSLKEGKQVS